MFPFIKPDPLIEAFDKAANEPIQNLIEKYLSGDENAGLTIQDRLDSWLTRTDNRYIKQFYKDAVKQNPRSANLNCLLGMICDYWDNDATLSETRDYYSMAMENNALAAIHYGSTFAEEDLGRYQHYLQQHPNHPLALLYFAHLQEKKAPKTAEQHYRSAAKQFPLYTAHLAVHLYNPDSRDNRTPFALFQEASMHGSGVGLISVAGFFNTGCGVVTQDTNRTAYYYRVAGNPSCCHSEAREKFITTQLSEIATEDEQNTVIAYHHCIFLQDYSKLKTLFATQPTKFIEYVVTYDLHRLQYEPWLKQQLLVLVADTFSPEQACLRALLTLSTLDDAPDKRAQLQLAAHVLTQISSITDNSSYALIVLQACLAVNHELAKLPQSEEKSMPVDVRTKLALFIEGHPSFLFDKVQGLPAVLKSTPAIDDSSKAVLESYAPHTRLKQTAEIIAENKGIFILQGNLRADEEKADLFDLQHYIELDDKKIFRKEARKQLRKATYGLILSTLEEFKAVQSEAKDNGVTLKKPDVFDVKVILTRILTNALTKERTFGEGDTHEFSDILRGLQNHLDHVIYEYQRFPKLFQKDLEALKKQKPNSTYTTMLAILKPSQPQVSATDNPGDLKKESVSTPTKSHGQNPNLVVNTQGRGQSESVRSNPKASSEPAPTTDNKVQSNAKPSECSVM